MHLAPRLLSPLSTAFLLLSACAGDDSTSVGESEATSASTGGSTGGSTTGDETESGASTSGSTSTASTTEATSASTSTTGGTSTGDPTTDATTDATTGVDPDQIPPTDSVDALLTWLEGESYTSWHAESAIHPSSGPHGGQVRTFINDALYNSLDQGQSAHPAGATAIKELWGDGQMRIGWAVEVKMQPDSDGGNGWYWYEKINMTEYGGDLGVGLCTGCHGGGIDYVLTPFPLQ